MKIAYVFSGQGAQKVGMGKDLCDSNAAAATIFATAEETLGWSMKELCFEGPEDKLQESRFCQPAIYTMSSACLAAFQEQNPNVEPVGCAGLSLGEYAALSAAKTLDFDMGLRLVTRRGELMDEACQETSGGMASVLGGDLAIIQEVCKANDIDVANYNCPGQVVISGEKEKVNAAVAMLREKGLRKVIPLKVAGAYHSRLMSSASERFASVLGEVTLNEPKKQIAQNFTGEFVTNTDDIAANLVSQVAGSVRWEECVRTLAAAGADTFIEFGPGNVLTGLLRRIDKSLTGLNVDGAESLAKVGEIISAD